MENYVLISDDSDLHDKVLFVDLDDTLVKTGYANYLAYKEAFQKVLKQKFDIVYDSSSRFTRESLNVYFPFLTTAQLRQIIYEKECVYHRYLPETYVDEDILKILDKWCTCLRTVLVTRCEEERVIEVLEYHGLRPKFSDLLMVNRCCENKFITAMHTLGIHSGEVVVFENDHEEINAACCAGVKYIFHK